MDAPGEYHPRFQGARGVIHHALWMKGFGQLRPLRGETARIQRVIDREFDIRRARRPPVILDTNALSAFIDGEPAVGVRLSAERQVAIPVMAGSPALAKR